MKFSPATRYQSNFHDRPGPRPINPSYIAMFRCDCGNPARFRLPLDLGLNKHDKETFNANLYLYTECLEKEKRQKQGYSQ